MAHNHIFVRISIKITGRRFVLSITLAKSKRDCEFIYISINYMYAIAKQHFDTEYSSITQIKKPFHSQNKNELVAIAMR